MIHLEKVSKRYDSEREALHQIDFAMRSGEMAFLTGHSGAGKTTLLKLIALIERTHQGRLIVNHFDLHQIKERHVPYFRRSIGIIFQNPLLLNDRPVFDNVALPLIISSYSQREISKRVRAALDKVGLLAKEKYLPSSLSSGEQQRIGIARAIVNKPKLLLADEPTGNLDPDLAREIFRLFEQFHQVGVTILIASHDLGLIATMAHRIITLKEGRIVSDQ